jgi:hypothetical protein
MSTVSLNLQPGLDRALAELAKSRALSKSALIREALEWYIAFAKHPAEGSFLALAKDYAGCVDGPPDLSSGAGHLGSYGRS